MYRYAQPMLKLTTFPINDATGIAIRRNSHLLLSSTEVEEVAQRLADLGVKNPLPLVMAAVQHGAIEIHAEGRPTTED